MSTERRPREGSQRGRFFALVLGAACVAVVGWAGWSGWYRLRVRTYEMRLIENRTPQGSLDAIAEIAHPAAVTGRAGS